MVGLISKYEDCDKAFNHKSSLCRHQLKHKDNAGFQCEQCGGFYTQVLILPCYNLGR